jgi:ABC-type dipeptide/oligopeptide/nickel transport system permease component
MRRLMLATIAVVSLSTLTGCFIPAYSGDPQRRARQYLNTSDDFAQILDEWERIWFLDQPSHMSIYRTHGGVL